MDFISKNKILTYNVGAFLLYMMLATIVVEARIGALAGPAFWILLFGWLVHAGVAMLLGIGYVLHARGFQTEGKQWLLAGLVIVLTGFSVCSITVPPMFDRKP